MDILKFTSLDKDSFKVEKTNGMIEYYSNGVLHRINGPAIIFADGRKEWFVWGVRHRENGPAIEYPNNQNFYYLYGKYFEYKDYNEEIKKILLSSIIV